MVYLKLRRTSSNSTTWQASDVVVLIAMTPSFDVDAPVSVLLGSHEIPVVPVVTVCVFWNFQV